MVLQTQGILRGDRREGEFPSPCGEMVLQTSPSRKGEESLLRVQFPSPCGEMVLQTTMKNSIEETTQTTVSVPLRGDGSSNNFKNSIDIQNDMWVSVPLRGDGSSNPASGNPLCARAPEVVCGAKSF